MKTNLVTELTMCRQPWPHAVAGAGTRALLPRVKYGHIQMQMER